MKVHGVFPILNVSDVPASLRFFEKFGFQPSFTWNAGGMIAGAADRDENGQALFAGVCSSLEGSDAQIFLCCGGQGARPGKPPRFDGNDDFGAVWISIFLGTRAEVDAAHEVALREGIIVIRPPIDEPWGLRECVVMHPDGHVLRFGSGVDCEEKP
jgi:predicted lactoylglutathione lyase